VHYCIARGCGMRLDEIEAQEFAAFAQAVSAVEQSHDFVVIDTPGTDSYMMRLAHSMADSLITPLNDSFVDFDVLGTIDPETYALDVAAAERALTPRTRAIVPVHLYGHPAPMDRVQAFARAYRLAVVEDAAQAIGASWAGKPVGAWGDAACLSFYPTKNLGACGDAGMVLTDRDDLAARLSRLRHHGDHGRYQHVEFGYSSRLDEVQAALLAVKVRHLDAWTERRRRIAARYRDLLGGVGLGLPVERLGARHVYHLFSVRHPQRDALQKALADQGVGTAVHYPLPVPGQQVFGGGGEGLYPEAWRATREVLSIPSFPELTDGEVERVAAAVRQACERL